MQKYKFIQRTNMYAHFKKVAFYCWSYGDRIGRRVNTYNGNESKYAAIEHLFGQNNESSIFGK